MGYLNAIGLKPTRKINWTEGGKTRQIDVTDATVGGLKIAILHTNTSRAGKLGPVKRMTVHWTGGDYTTGYDDYHFFGVWNRAKREAHIVKALSIKTMGEHAFKANTGNVGLSLCGMAGATRGNLGNYQIEPAFLRENAIFAAEFCAWHGLDPRTQLVDHQQVDREIGRGAKWDIEPYWPEFHRQACEHFALLKSNKAQFKYLDLIKE